MADSGGGFSRNICKNETFRGRIATKLPLHPITRLQYREIGGIHRHNNYHGTASSQVYSKLPGRLGFLLRSLVDEITLDEGHVFLGFTKSGQFVISYTLHVEADDHTAYPIYVFRLQWWRFIPYKRLKKWAEVRLFGEEDIQQDLQLIVCEWPTDDTRVLVHGCCAPSDNEKRQCYVTVTAVPPVGPCEDCSQLAILRAQNDFQESSGMSSAPPRCLNHAFAVHTKYELAPPYPPFLPYVFLKIDGVVIVNTGDSLVALSVNIEDNHNGFGFGLYSPRVTRSVSNLSTTNSTISEDQLSVSSHGMFDSRPLRDVNELATDPLRSVIGGSPCSNPAVHRSPATPKDTTNNPTEIQMRTPPFKERHASSGKENHLNKQLGSPDSGANQGRMARSLDVYNFEAGTPKKDEDSGTDVCDTGPDSDSSGHCPPKVVRTTLSFTGFQQGARIPSSTEEISLTQNESMDSQQLEEPEKTDPFEKPSGLPRWQPRESSSSTLVTQRNLSALTLVPPENLPFGRSLAVSPGYGKWEAGSSTCSSCVSSPIILQSESQCFTYSVRRYVETYGMSRPDSPIDLEDDLNLAYHSLLPLEVHGANYSSMRLLTKQSMASQTPYVVVKQLTLDIEHYLGETIRQFADWGKRYLAFTDYDVQVIEVCPGTSEVIAIVYALIRARPPKDANIKHAHGISRTVPKLYRTACKLIWNLQTGSYNTLDVEDLTEINQSELLRQGVKKWHPGSKGYEVLTWRYAIRSQYCNSVHILTNESVFKGRSLKMLLDKHHYVALLL